MNREHLKIALAQLDYKVGDFERNVSKIRAAIGKCDGADIIVFSELALTGYYPQDLLDEPAFQTRHDAALQEILNASRETTSAIVLGAATRNRGAGKPHHNALLLIQGGKMLLEYHKQLLPTYNVFDELRHFEPGERRAAVFEHKGFRVGYLICEDGWNDLERDYPVNPARTLAEAEVDLIVSINASPSNVGKQRQRHAIFSAVAKRHNVPLLYVNQVGGNDQLVFDGGSFLVDAQQGVVHELPLFEEAVELVGFDGGFFNAERRFAKPIDNYPVDPEFYYRQIVLGLTDYAEKVGFKRAVVGCSGGVDSALTIALACDALGPGNVHAITMPSSYSSAGSVDDSKTLRAALGVKLFTHEIASIFEPFKTDFAKAFAQEPSLLTRENVQARIRGTILMEFSNHFGHLVLSTGNKSEISVGYTTLYGDMNGGLNLIGDLYKTEVYALARYYNDVHGRQIIPEAILAKEPSAELSMGQKDTDTLPPYPILDEILKLHIEGSLLRPAEYEQAKAFVEELKASGQAELVQRIHGMVAKAEFKRRQAPPIIRCRSRAFGNGRQMPIAAKY